MHKEFSNVDIYQLSANDFFDSIVHELSFLDTRVHAFGESQKSLNLSAFFIYFFKKTIKEVTQKVSANVAEIYLTTDGLTLKYKGAQINEELINELSCYNKLLKDLNRAFEWDLYEGDGNINLVFKV